MAQACDICQNVVIPDSVYELLDWEAVADSDRVVCAKCIAGLVRTQDADIHVKIAKKSASLVSITWKQDPADKFDHIETAIDMYKK